MTIDEAILQEKELSEHCKRMFEEMNTEDKLANKLLKNEIQYHKQFAEWLEELKVYHQHEVICNKGYNAGYNKAIDDFVHECDKCCGFYSGKNKNITREDILKIAEQLKAGGENDITRYSNEQSENAIFNSNI